MRWQPPMLMRDIIPRWCSRDRIGTRNKVCYQKVVWNLAGKYADIVETLLQIATLTMFVYGVGHGSKYHMLPHICIVQNPHNRGL